MVKKIFSILTLLAYSLFYPRFTFANVSFNINQPAATAPATGLSVGSAVSFILNLLVAIGIVASLAYLLYGGIKYITSGGDKQAVEAARSHIIAAIIGLVIIILSFAIVTLILSILGLGGVNITQFNFPGITG